MDFDQRVGAAMALFLEVVTMWSVRVECHDEASESAPFPRFGAAIYRGESMLYTTNTTKSGNLTGFTVLNIINSACFWLG